VPLYEYWLATGLLDPPDRLWVPPSGYLGYFLGVKRPGNKADYLPRFVTKFYVLLHLDTSVY